MSGPAADGLRMAGIAEHLLTARANGRPYVIKIALPAEDPPERGYPVLYALDADATFLTMAEAVKLQTRKPHGYDAAVVVGIGYPSGEPFDMTRRCYDFTMPAAEGTLPQRPDGRPWPEHGGADLFLGFIEHELIPYVDGRFKTDPDRRTLYGHSLGGLLALHAFFTGSAPFAGYAAGSPSIWWGDYALLRELEAFAGRADAGRRSRLLLMVGADELAHMVEDAVSLHERLGELRRENSAWTAELVRFADEEHVSVLPAAISRSIRFALAAPAE